MGSRASQPLRNRQQVQDSSSAQAVAPQSFPSDEVVKGDTIISNNNNHSNVNLNSDLDVNKIKETLEQIGTQLFEQQENGDAKNAIEAKQSNGSSNSQASKASTLQRQASHIQSLAQRIRRSSSIRAPKLKSLLPAFINKRKVSKAYAADTYSSLASKTVVGVNTSIIIPQSLHG